MKHTLETRKKMSETRKRLGIKPPSPRGRIVSIETRKKLSESQKGKKLSIEHRKNISIAHKGKPKLTRRGENSPNWKGGKSRSLDKIIRVSLEYRQWRCDVFQRDNYQCVIGGKSHGNKLQADHIKAFSLILRENKVSSLEDALNCEELWNINNGRTLCIPCHVKTKNFGGKSNIII